MSYSTLFPYITMGSIAALLVGYIIYKMTRKPNIVVVDGVLTVNILISKITGSGEYTLITRGALKDFLETNPSICKLVKKKSGYNISMLALLTDNMNKFNNITFIYSKGFDGDIKNLIEKDDIAVISI